MTQRTLFKVFLLGLPLGLALIGGGSLIVHSQRSKTPAPAEGASIQRRPVAKADLAFFIQRLAADIGPRPADDPAVLKKTFSFIEGMLGQNNFGYAEVRRQPYQAAGRELANLSVELPGRSSNRRGEIILVGARCDTAALSPGANNNASGVAALLSLAQAFVGSTQERTLRFVAFGNGIPPLAAPDQTGPATCAASSKARDEKLAGVILLGSLGSFADAPGTQRSAAPAGPAWPATGNFVAFLGCGSESAFQKDLAASFTAASTMPAESGFAAAPLPGSDFSDSWAFHQAGFPSVLITDTAGFRYPDNQLISDTPEKIDLDRLTLVVKGIEQALRELLNPDSRVSRAARQ